MTEIEELIGIQTMIEFFLIFFLSFIGSFAKVYLKIIRSPDRHHGRKNVIEVILSTFTATIFIFTFSTTIQDKIGTRGLVLASFLGGLVGFELLTRISSLHGLFDFVSKTSNLYNDYTKMSQEKESEMDKLKNRFDD